MRGNRWRVFAVIFVLVILLGAITLGVTLGDRPTGTLVVLGVRVVLNTLALPVSALAAAVLYYDLRPSTE